MLKINIEMLEHNIHKYIIIRILLNINQNSRFVRIIILKKGWVLLLKIIISRIIKYKINKIKKIIKLLKNIVDKGSLGIIKPLKQEVGFNMQMKMRLST